MHGGTGGSRTREGFLRQDALTRQVIGCFFTAYNELGFGFTESVYSAALEILFREIGLLARREHGIDVMFRDPKVGTFRVDYLIEDTLVLELKAGHQLPVGSRAQLITYLRTSKKNLGLLLFFGPSPRSSGSLSEHHGANECTERADERRKRRIPSSRRKK